VLVVYDMLDIYPGRKARFVRNFMEGAPSVKAAIEAYVKAVKAGTFPGPSIASESDAGEERGTRMNTDVHG